MHYYKLDKFNTIVLKLSLLQELNKEEATLRALIPYILNDGSTNYPTQTLINKRLDQLYGATLSIGTITKGNLSDISISVAFVNPKIVNDPNYTIKDIYDLVYDIIFNPKLVNNTFDSSLVNHEKALLKQEIEAQKENKNAYAINNAIEELYKDSIYSIRSIGYIKDIDQIDSDRLYNYYMKCLNNDEIKIFILGDVEEKDLDFINIRSNIKLEKKLFNTENTRNNDKEIIKEDKINQSVLTMIYKTDIYANSEDYVNALVFNYIFGASPSSLLFKVIREEHGLCYSIHSNYMNESGLFLINMGIQKEDYSKCVDLVNDQIKFMKEINLDEKVLEEAKVSIQNKRLLQEDSQSYYLRKMLNKELFEFEITAENFLERLEKVSIEDIKLVASKLTHKLTYFLKGEEHEEV